MTHVSRPLIALLAGTVLFFALWMVALKPSSSSSNGGTLGGQGGLGQYQSAINSAKHSVQAQNQQSANAGGIPGTATTTPAAASSVSAAGASPPATTTPAATTSTPAQPAAGAGAKRHAAAAPASAGHVAGARHRFDVVAAALREHKVIAMLFYNPAGADDQAVRHELSSIPTYKGRVVKLTVPISELSRYTQITTQVMVSTTPTLVLIDRNHQASLITGYATGFEIGTLVASALGR